MVWEAMKLQNFFNIIILIIWGVAFADEGVDLRKWYYYSNFGNESEQGSYDTIIDYKSGTRDLNLRVLELFTHQLQLKGIQKKISYSFKIETGIKPSWLLKNMKLMNFCSTQKNINVKVASIFSHLSSSDIPEEKNILFSQIEFLKEFRIKLFKRTRL